MADKWTHIFADWATDNGISVTSATLSMEGTPLFADAQQRFDAGACERVIRPLLDRAYAATQLKP